jgi:hypothetical protein
MGMDQDLSTRPLVFNPKGFLVAVLDDTEACVRARAALLEAGFGETDLRVYTSEQILNDHELFLAARSKTRRVVGALTDDQATIELYFGYAAEGRGALWVHVPEKRDASRAMRYLVDQHVLHYRYFGPTENLDIHVPDGSA